LEKRYEKDFKEIIGKIMAKQRYYRKQRKYETKEKKFYGEGEYEMNVSCSDPILLEVSKLYPEEDGLRLIKRFLKKWKRAKLSDEFKKYQYYTKPSLIKKAKEARRNLIMQKITEKDKNKE